MGQKNIILEADFPVNYREDIASQIFDYIKKSESFSLIGMEDNCKSNLCRFICSRSDIHRKYLGIESSKYNFIFIDLNEMVSPTLEGFYRLFEEVISEGKLSQFDKHEKKNTKSLKYYKELISRRIEKGNKLVIFFNDFDFTNNFIDQLSRNLVSLRNSSRYNIIFIFIGKRPFAPKEFFFQKIVYMTPFAGQDAQGVVERNCIRYGVKLTEKDKCKVIELSGGHAGLIKFIIQNIGNGNKSVIIRYDFSALSDINFQCERILFPLTDIEKAKLKANIADTYLERIGIQKIHKGKIKIFSSILQKYLGKNGNCIPPFCYDEELNEIYYFGQPITKDLSAKENEILKFLIKNPERIFTRDQIIENTWGNEEFPTDWAFDKLISRLRKKLKQINNSDNDYPRTIHGNGYSLY